MRISKIICDRCGGEIGGPLAHIVPIFIDPETGDTVMGCQRRLPDQTGKEYCITCTERIMAFANNVTKSSGQGQPSAEAGENRMKRYTANIPTVQTVAAHGGMAAADASVKEPEAVQEPEQSGKGAKTRPEAEQSRKKVETAQETADGL